MKPMKSNNMASSFTVEDNKDEELGVSSSPLVGDNGVVNERQATTTTDTLYQQPLERTPSEHSHARSRVGSFLSSMVGKHDDEGRTSFITGRWKSLGSRRLIKFGVSTNSDIGDRRGMVAIPISEETCKAMESAERLKIMGERMLRRSPDIEDCENGEGTGNVKPMYRLQLTRQNQLGCFRRSLACFLACLNCGAHTESSTEQNLFLGLGNPNRWLVDFFYWLFRKGWLTIFVVSVVMFYILVVVFAVLIICAATMDSDCIRIGDKPFGDSGTTRSLAAQAFALSWHTFSTVGYGSTYPALSTQHNHDKDVKCAFINFICPLEALVGVIFAGFTGAVFFAKVTRVSQRAPVKFCQPLLIKTGNGASNCNIHDTADTAQDDPKNKRTLKSLANQVSQPSPFPVLEFRLANEMHSQPGGEIIDANVNVVVINESTNDSEFEVGMDMAKQIAMNRTKRSTASMPTLRKTTTRKLTTEERATETSSNREGSLGSVSSEGSRATKYSMADTATAYLQGLNSLAHRATGLGAKTIKVDEETTGSSRIVPRLIFSKLSLDNSEHPMFRRVWSFRHVIDQDSPLLTKEARQKIIMNGGAWKGVWNTPEYIRKAIHFNEMIVSFTGVSTLSNFSVYKQKAYDTSNIVIGYEFVNMLYHSKRGNLKVDLSLLNDVIEQTDGVSETFNV